MWRHCNFIGNGLRILLGTGALLLWIPFAHAAVSTDGLVGYWKFDEGAGTVALDASGNGNTGTMGDSAQAGTGWVAGTTGTNFYNPYGLEFDGVDDYVNCGNDSSLELPLPITVSLWAKHRGTGSYKAIFASDGDATHYAGVLVQMQPDGTIAIYYGDGIASSSNHRKSKTGTTSLSSNTWYHILAIWRGATNMSIYINGADDNGSYSGSAVGPIAYTASPALINSDGAVWNGNEEFNGSIDDVRIYNRALTTTEIADLANGEHPTITWDGSSDSDWETAANWTPASVPDAYSNILIPDVSNDPVLPVAHSGASVTVEAGAVLNINGNDFEMTDGGAFKGGGTLKVKGSETLTNFVNSSTGTVLYFGTGSTYAGLNAGDSYYNLTINDGLVGYWKFDEGAGTVARDSSAYGNDGTMGDSAQAGTGWVVGTTNINFTNPYALEFDGINDSIISDVGTINLPVTLSAWVNTGGEDLAGIVGVGSVNSGSESIWIEILTNGNFKIGFYGNDVAAGWSASNTINQWVHIAGTIDASRVQTGYVNGSSVGTFDGSNAYIGDGEVRIGQGCPAAEYVKGRIDDVRIYNRALSSSEVTTLAAGNISTGVGVYTLDAALDVSNDLAIYTGGMNNSGNYDITLSGSWLNYGGVYTEGTETITFDGTPDSEDAKKIYENASLANITLDNGLVGYWKFDEGAGTVARDSSAYGNDGTMGDSAQAGTGWVTGATGTNFYNPYALEFDGSNDYLDMGTIDAVDSVSLWFKTTTADTERLFVYGNDDSTFFFSANKLYFRMGLTVQTSASGLNDGAWHHAVGVYESADVAKLYVDGSYVNSFDPLVPATPSDFLVGSKSGTQQFFDGLLDDIRIYNRALALSEIETLAAGNLTTGSGIYTLGASLDISGDLRNYTGDLVSSGSITIQGDWYNAGDFSHDGGGTVNFNGTNQSISGSTVFWNLTHGQGGDTLTFDVAARQSVSGALVLQGSSSSVLNLRSSLNGTAFKLLLDGSAGTQSLQYLNVQDSDASGGAVCSATYSIDGGNNTNWSISNVTGGSASIRRAALWSASTSGGGSSTSTAVSAVTTTVTFTPDYSAYEQMLAEAQDRTSGGSGTLLETRRRLATVRDALVERFNDMLLRARLQEDEQSVFAELAKESEKMGDTERKLLRARAKTRVHASAVPLSSPNQIAERRGRLAAVVDDVEVLFEDVLVAAWYAPFVSFLIEEDIAQGYKDEEGKPLGEFGVANPVTRAEALKMSLEAGSDDARIVVNGTPRNASAQGTWASAYVAKAEEMGISTFGTSVDVHQSATRGEVVQTLLEVMRIPTGIQAAQFYDVPQSHPYTNAIGMAAFLGIIEGDSDSSGNALGTFRPDAEINRAEVSKIIALAKELMK